MAFSSILPCPPIRFLDLRDALTTLVAFACPPKPVRTQSSYLPRAEITRSSNPQIVESSNPRILESSNNRIIE